MLARALPAFTVDDPRISTGREAGLAQARWRSAGAVAGEAAFACRLCTARRTGQRVRAVRYLPRWRRVCVRHGRWLLDADGDQPLEHLDLCGVPEVAAAQRRSMECGATADGCAGSVTGAICGPQDKRTVLPRSLGQPVAQCQRYAIAGQRGHRL